MRLGGCAAAAWGSPLSHFLVLSHTLEELGWENIERRVLNFEKKTWKKAMK